MQLVENTHLQIPLNRQFLYFCNQKFCRTNPDLTNIYKQKSEKLKLKYFGYKVDYTTNSISLNKGLKSDLLYFLNSNNIKYEYVDNQVDNPLQNISFDPNIKLYDYQEKGKEIFLSQTRGVISFECGMGKTILAIKLIAEIKQKTLVLVHTTKLQKQWIDEIKKNLIGNYSLGMIGDSHFQIKHVTIAIINSVYRQPRTSRLFDNFGFIISDECHHIPADTFFDTITKFRANYILGLSATPIRKDGKEFLLKFAIGNIIYQKKRKISFVKKLYIENCLEIPKTVVTASTLKKKKLKMYRWIPLNRKFTKLPNWVDCITALTQLESRNEKIFSRVEHCASRGRRILVLSDRVAHCKSINRYFSKKYRTQLLIGGEDTYIKNDTQIIIGTKIADEGMDVKWLDTLHLTCPLSVKGNITNILDQRIGRILRDFEGKNSIEVYLYKDIFVNFFKVTCDRIETYLKTQDFIVQNIN